MVSNQPRDAKGRWTKRSTGLIAALTAALALAGGGSAGLGGSALSSGGAGAGGSASSASSARSTQVRQQDSAAARLRLERRGLRAGEPEFDVSTDCAAHSYGQVREFFRRQPCAALFRASLEVRDRRNNVVLVAIAWVEMPDASSAREYHRLVDTHGTGNVRELTRDRGRYQDVRFTGEHYESRRDGTTVVNAQVQPAGRGTAAEELEAIVLDALG